MAAVETLTSAARIPGPPELLPGRPDAIVDLQTAEGVALVRGQWRYADARVDEIEFVELGSPGDPLGPGTVPNRTYDIVRDGGWRELAPEQTMDRLANGGVCFNFYAIDVTLPERVGELDVTGSTVLFEVVIDDYAEVWVDGELPFTLGDTGGHVAAGFNAPNRVVLTRDARPGQTFQLEVFGINGPISASPHNYIWMRTATLDLYAPERARVADDALLEVEGDLPGDLQLERVATGTGPNGLAFSPDERWLYVGNWDFERIVVMRYDPETGEGSVFYDMTTPDAEDAIDGMKVDPDGKLYVCGPGGIWVLSPDGEHLGTLRLPEAPHNLAWGDADGRTLYITALTSVYRLRLGRSSS